jgi:hypothetical protein
VTSKQRKNHPGYLEFFFSLSKKPKLAVAQTGNRLKISILRSDGFRLGSGDLGLSIRKQESPEHDQYPTGYGT